MNELDLTFVDSTVGQIGTGKDKVLEILQALQAHYGFLPREALQRLCQFSEITPALVAGVSSFYDRFRYSPAGRHTIRICIGTACHIKGADSVYDAFQRHRT